MAWVKPDTCICLKFANSSVASLTKLDRDPRNSGHVIWQQLAYRQITLVCSQGDGATANSVQLSLLLNSTLYIEYIILQPCQIMLNPAKKCTRMKTMDISLIMKEEPHSYRSETKK